MIKRFFRDGFIYTLSSILTRGISIILFPIYVNILTPADYGILDYLQVLSSFLLIIVSFEVGQGLARFLPELVADRKQVKNYSSSALFFITVTFIFLGAAAFLSSKRLAVVLLGNEDYAVLIKIVAVNILKNAVVNQIIIQLQAELKAFQSASLSFANGTLNILFTILFLLVFKLGIVGALAAQVCSGLIVLLFGLYLIRNNLHWGFNLKALKTMLSFSLPLIPSSVFVVLALYIDRLAIRNMMSLEDLGIYSVGSKIAAVITLVMVGFQRSITPLVYHHYKEKDTPGQIASLFRFFVVLALITVSGLSLFSINILDVIAPPAYLPAYQVVPILVFASIFGKIYIFSPGLTIAKRTKIVAVINFITALVNTGLNFLLIPHIGILGAAVATLTGSILMAVGYFYWGEKSYSIPHYYRESLTGTLSVSVILAFFLIVDNVSLHMLFLKIAAFIFIVVVLLPLVKLVNKNDLLLLGKP